MSAGWRWDPERLRADLEALGYDVDAADPALAEGGGRLSARRDTGSRSHVLVVDAGGRFRVEVTHILDETGWSDALAGLPVRVATEMRRTMTVTGTLAGAGQLTLILDSLGEFARSGRNRAGDAATDPHERA